MKILIIKPSSLGDIVQSLPVLTGLKRRWPHADIDWLVFHGFADVLKGHPCLHQVIPLPQSLKGGISALREWSGVFDELQEKRYDLSIDLQGLFRSGWMSFRAGARTKIGLASSREGSRVFYDELVKDRQKSAADRYLEVLRHLGISPERYDFQLRPVTNDFQELRQTPYVVLHPYTRWETKLWPWRYYSEVAAAMGEMKCVVVGQGDWFPLQSKNMLDYRNRLSLPQLIEVVSGAKAVVSTDSGPAHLAAALGRPVLAIFGSTDPERTSPSGPCVKVISEKLPCVPCRRRECTNSQIMECMITLRPERVIGELKQMI